MNDRDAAIGILDAKITSLEQMRDEHQRQLLELGGLFSQMQDTMLTMTTTMATQQRTISMLIDNYVHDVGPLPAVLVLDELAAKRDTES